jgi:hypothetical protein
MKEVMHILAYREVFQFISLRYGGIEMSHDGQTMMLKSREQVVIPNSKHHEGADENAYALRSRESPGVHGDDLPNPIDPV